MAMPARKFEDGQTVVLVHNKRFARAAGSYEVGRMLPNENGVNRYLILSTVNGQQRVVSEYEIA